MKYESIVWDWNGTLLDDVELALGIVNDILLDHRQQELTTSRYQQIFDFPVQLYYERAGMDFSVTSFEAVSERYCKAFEENIDTAQLFECVPDSLALLKAAGMRQFVLSSTEHEALLRMVNGFHIAPIFNDIRGMPDGFARGKTSVGQELAQAHCVDASKAVIVGDTKHDWEVAEALGMDCLLVSTGHHSHERLQSVGCPVFASVSDIAKYLSDS